MANYERPLMTTVAILLFEDCDLLDVGGPYEVFLTAARLTERAGEDKAFEVITVSPDGFPVTSYGGMGLVPLMAADQLESADVVVIPGAIAIADVSNRLDVRASVQHLVDLASIATSVCTGAFLLGDQNMLNDIPWTTHHEDVDDLAAHINSTEGKSHVRWVDTGNVVTAGGLSSGIAMALHIVERLQGRELAVQTAAQIEYDWDPDAGFTSSTT